MAISIANARLYQRISEEEQRLERDLEMAREVQLRLLPSAASAAAAGGDCDGVSARAVDRRRHLRLHRLWRAGNALYKTSQRKRIAIVLGDVSGKAAPAALYAALVSGILRSLAARHLPPADLLAELNNQLQERKLDAQYVTMLMAVWNDDARTLQMANAGSVQPLYVSSVAPGLRLRRQEGDGGRPCDCSGRAGDGFTIETIQAGGFSAGTVSRTRSMRSSRLRRSPATCWSSSPTASWMRRMREGEMFGTERLCRRCCASIRRPATPRRLRWMRSLPR